MAKNLRNVYQIKVSLDGVKPQIWRRLLISSTTDLGELHEIIQIAMGWEDSHLHQFVVGDARYGVPDPEFDDGIIPEESIRISSLLKKEKEWIAYEYDFGDGWEHNIVLEKILPYTLGETVPKCVAGRRGCPPEDVGGVWGYQEFLEIYKDPKHPEHERMVEWAGEYFDPERFDQAEINEIFSGEG
ncbi:MAG: plasmid pRiA4b ORF-3 family protein [Nitrospirota bacterium]|nr:plasmid pRiA4b ORF-3 family protein [Nitrospirota bacterium]